MTQFDQSKWRKNQLLSELGLQESVADQAAKAMGLPKRDDDYANNEDEDVSFVASILGNE